MTLNYYTVIAIVLFSSSAMADQQNATCIRYGFDVDNPGVSCADIYDKTPPVMINQVITLSKLQMINTPYIVTWSWSVVDTREVG